MRGSLKAAPWDRDATGFCAVERGSGTSGKLGASLRADNSTDINVEHEIDAVVCSTFTRSCFGPSVSAHLIKFTAPAVLPPSI